VSEYSFVKGHGTENDFVLVPDANGQHELAAEQVARLCDRRAGIGGDGVIRVVRTDATEDPAAVAARGEATWFMDYRNSDGSLSEMCGNGIRVLGRFLAGHADVDPRNPLPIATRAGVKVLTFDGNLITVDMGAPEVLGSTTITVGERSFEARHVSMGNPHAVVFVDDLAEAGSLLEAPGHDAATYPDGVNVEFVARRGERHVAMRVHERGSGETRSCGTGACAVMVAAALADEAERGTPYTVDLPGGTLEITWTEDDRVLLTGPAVLTAEGVTNL
jgi:diaminopimelate epimerase